MKNSSSDRKSNRKKPKSFRLSYSAGLLLLMVVIGGASGLIAYRFGQQALEGVTATPAGVKLPRPSAPATATPPASPKDKDNGSPKPKSDKVSDGSYWMLSESEIIAESQQVIRDGLAGVTVPVRFPEKPQQRRQRRELVADSLALSRNLDDRVSDRNISERIAELRAELWQRSSLYPSLQGESRVGNGAANGTIYSRTYSIATAGNPDHGGINNPINAAGNSTSRSLSPTSDVTANYARGRDSSNSGDNLGNDFRNNYFLVSPPSVMPTPFNRGQINSSQSNGNETPRRSAGSSFIMPLSERNNR